MRQNYSRRDFLKTAGLVLVATSSSGILAACGDSGAPGSGSGSNAGNSSGSGNTDTPSGGDSDNKDPDAGKGDNSEKPDVIDPAKIEWTCNAKGELTGCNTALTGTVTLPSRIDNIAITSIQGNFYANSSSRGFHPTEIIFPDSITYVDYGAFSHCSSVQKVTLSAQLKTISAYAFAHCSALTEVILPESVGWVEGNAFSGCESLKRVALSSNLTEIRQETFQYCNKLKAVYIPKSIENVNPGAFEQTSPYSLEYVYYGGSKDDWKELARTESFHISGRNDALKEAPHFVYDATKKKFLAETANL